MADVVKKDDTVKVHYTGKFDGGEVFDSSDGRDPLEFKVGAGTVIPGFENGVMGMAVGDEKTLAIEPADGYGEYLDDQIVTLEQGAIEGMEDVKKGEQLYLERNDGEGTGRGGPRSDGRIGNPGHQPPPGGEKIEFRHQAGGSIRRLSIRKRAEG